MSDRILASLQYRHRSKYYITLILLYAISASASTGRPYWIFGIIGAALFSFFYRKAKLPDDSFDRMPSFPESAKTITDLKAAKHYDHEGVLTFGFSRRFRGVHGSQAFLAINYKRNVLLLTPNMFWSYLDKKYSSGPTNTIKAAGFYYEETSLEVKAGDDVVKTVWRYATKSGDRDYRYHDNYEMYLLHRHGIELTLPDHSQWNFGTFNTVEARDAALAPFLAISQNATAGSENQEEADVHAEPSENVQQIRSWHEELGVSEDATAATIKAAYHEKLKQYHPDRVDGLGVEFKRLAEERTVALNLAYSTARKRQN